MKKATIPTEIITVPEGECAMNILAGLGEETRNSWIFIHKEQFTKLREKADGFEHEDAFGHLNWDATDEFPETYLGVILGSNSLDYVPVFKIEADDIVFKKPAATPERIFFIR